MTQQCHLERSVSEVDRACLALASARRAGRSQIYEILHSVQNDCVCHLERSVSGVDRACLALASARRAGRSQVYEILRADQNKSAQTVIECVEQ